MSIYVCTYIHTYMHVSLSIYSTSARRQARLPVASCARSEGGAGPRAGRERPRKLRRESDNCIRFCGNVLVSKRSEGAAEEARRGGRCMGGGRRDAR